jgi:hypothetical protein
VRLSYALVAMVSLTFVGCGGSGVPPVPVSGKVLWKGQPVTEATITFLSKTGGRSASGRTSADGSFTLTTNRTGDGAPPGEYAVTVSKVEAKGGGSAGVDISSGDYGAAYGQMMGAAGTNTMSKVLKDVLPAKYGNAEQSGLIRTVVKGEDNTFDFDLE